MKIWRRLTKQDPTGSFGSSYDGFGVTEPVPGEGPCAAGGPSSALPSPMGQGPGKDMMPPGPDPRAAAVEGQQAVAGMPVQDVGAMQQAQEGVPVKQEKEKKHKHKKERRPSATPGERERRGTATSVTASPVPQAAEAIPVDDGLYAAGASAGAGVGVAQGWGGGWGDAGWGDAGWSGEYQGAQNPTAGVGTAAPCAATAAAPCAGAPVAADGWGEGWSGDYQAAYAQQGYGAYPSYTGQAGYDASYGPGSPGAPSAYDGGYGTAAASPAPPAFPAPRPCDPIAPRATQQDYDNIYGRANPVASRGGAAPDTVVRPGDLDWVKPGVGAVSASNFLSEMKGLESEWSRQNRLPAFEEPSLNLSGRPPVTKFHQGQSADDWLNILTKEAQDSLAESQDGGAAGHVKSGTDMRLMAPVMTAGATAPLDSAALQPKDGPQVYSGPLSWIASPSAITGFLGQSELRQSVNMIQQIAAAEMVLRAELRHEVSKMREELDMERFAAIQKEHEMKRLQGACMELTQRLEESQRKLNQLQQESAAEDFRLAQTIELSRVDRAEQYQRNLAAQAQLEQDTLLLNRRLEDAMAERNEFVNKSAILQARLEEEHRKTAVENASVAARLISVEQQVGAAVALSGKRVLRESDAQTARDAGAEMPWAIEPKRLEKYEAAFLRADTDGDGYVTGAEARVVLDKTGLPQMELSHIWNLADADRDGRLTAGEFIVALHLAYKRSKEGVSVPPALPPELRTVLTEGTAVRPPTRKAQPEEEYATQLGGGGPAGSQPQASGPAAHDAFAAGFAAGFAAVPQAPPPPPPQVVTVQAPAPAPQVVTVERQVPVPVPVPAPAAVQVQGAPAPTPSPAPLAMPPAPQMCMQVPPAQRAAGILPEEMQQYGQLFQDLDKRGAGIIGAQEGKDFFEQSGLPTDELAHIWQISDRDGDGHLSLAEFACAMAIVTRRRNGEALPQTAPADLIVPGASAVPAGGGLQPPSPASASAVDNASFIPSAEEVESYASIFGTLDDDKDGLLGPLQVKVVMDRSGLPDQELAHIWDLSDADKDGNLNLPEFVCALTLVDRRLKGLSLPPSLPRDLAASASSMASRVSALKSEPAPTPPPAAEMEWPTS